MEAIVATLRKSFATRTTFSYEWRKTQLQALQRLIDENKEELFEALRHDLNKPPQETVMMELGIVTNAVTYALKNLHSWMKPQKVNPIIQARALYSFYTHHDPLGVIFIIGAWNYPLQLTLMPLVGALAGGNCALVKPSELSIKTAEILEKLWPKYFDQNFIALVNGGVPETTELLKQRFFD